MKNMLIAGMGNVLRRDDGFGVEIAKRLMAENHFPSNVKIIEVGIGGIHLVQELMHGYDALIVVDALERGSAPGTLHVLEANVPNLKEWDADTRGDFLADMHYTTPGKAMILSKALDVLPPCVYLVGVQPLDASELGIGLSEPVARAIPQTLRAVERIVQQIEWQEHVYEQ